MLYAIGITQIYQQIPPPYLNNLNPSKSGIPWNNMDVIGLTFYPKLATTNDASTEEMYNEALRQIDKYLWPLSWAYGKQLFIEDCFCSGYDGCAMMTQSNAKIDKEEQKRWSTALLRAFAHANQTGPQPLFKGITMQIYRMMEDAGWPTLPPSEKTAPPQLNDSAGRQDLQKLMMVYYSNKPLVSRSE